MIWLDISKVNDFEKMGAVSGSSCRPFLSAIAGSHTYPTTQARPSAFQHSPAHMSFRPYERGWRHLSSYLCEYCILELLHVAASKPVISLACSLLHKPERRIQTRLIAFRRTAPAPPLRSYLLYIRSGSWLRTFVSTFVISF